jgi:ABC-type transport system involved in multi-copper enzyme maturation permease subunit
MIRLSLRQFRTQSWVALGLLAVVAILFASTGSHIAHIYDAYAKAETACVASTRCQQVNVVVGTFDRLLELIGTILVALPALIGAFWGAPLISRELESGTHRLAWTQSVTRTRWLAVKLGVVGAASVAATGLLSLMVTWWSAPIDRADSNRFGAGLFGERNITPLGYAAFGFVLGVGAGLLIRRTLPAMAATLGVFLGVRIGFTYLVRPYLLTPKHLSLPLGRVVQGFGSTNDGPTSLFAGPPNLPDAWVYSTRIVDGSGHGLTSVIATNACPALAQPLPLPGSAGTSGSPGAAPANGQDALQACVTKLSSTYHGLVTYQPASRYWIFQWYETGIFVAAAAVLAALCFYWVRHRA